MKKVKEQFWGILNNIISNAIWELLVRILTPTIVVSILSYYKIPAFILFIVVGSGFVSIIFLVLKYKKIEFPYIFLKREVYFEYCGTFSIYTISCKAKAMCNGVDRYYSRYTWNPKKVDMTCLEPENSYIVPHVKNDVYHKYDMVFGGRKYNTGDKYDIKLESIMHGDVQFPLFATTVIKPTKLLVIHVKVPVEILKSGKIRCVTKPSPSEIGVQDTKDALLDENGEYIWKIKNPKLSYEYSIEWDFNESKKREFIATCSKKRG